MKQDYRNLIICLIFMLISIMSLTGRVFAGNHDKLTKQSSSDESVRNVQSNQSSSADVTVMVLVQENHIDLNTDKIQMAETEIIRLLRQHNFKLVDSGQIDAVKKRNATTMALSGDFKEAKYLGLKYDSQYIIIGMAVVKNAGEPIQGTRFKSIQAVLQFKILKTNTGEILEAGVKQAVVAHINELTGATEALKQAASEAVQTSILPVLNSDIRYHQKEIPIQLNILGVDTFKQYKKIVEMLESLDNITSLQNQGWNKSGSLLSFEVIYQGTTELLADLIDQHKFDAGKLYIEDISSNKLIVRYRD
jgi:hypothetical protein